MRARERERDDKWRGKCIGGRKSLSSELTIVSTNFATQRFATFPENYFKLHKPVKLYNPGHFLELIPSKYLLDTRGGGGEGGVLAAVVIVEQIYIYIYIVVWRRIKKGGKDDEMTTKEGEKVEERENWNSFDEFNIKSVCVSKEDRGSNTVILCTLEYYCEYFLIGLYIYIYDALTTSPGFLVDL